jgi:hypothetical protein
MPKTLCPRTAPTRDFRPPEIDPACTPALDQSPGQETPADSIRTAHDAMQRSAAMLRILIKRYPLACDAEDQTEDELVSDLADRVMDELRDDARSLREWFAPVFKKGD